MLKDLILYHASCADGFAAAWAARLALGAGKVVWSLRSRDGGVDVSEVARRRGGGGHPRAAGFETERVSP